MRFDVLLLERGGEFGRRNRSGPTAWPIVPLVRSIDLVAAGGERMPLLRFTLVTAAGSAVWNADFVAAGTSQAPAVNRRADRPARKKPISMPDSASDDGTARKLRARPTE